MAEYKLLLPAMGESVDEATVTQWLKNEGDIIEVDDAVVEIATDKVDSEVPSEISRNFRRYFGVNFISSNFDNGIINFDDIAFVFKPLGNSCLIDTFTHSR